MQTIPHLSGFVDRLAKNKSEGWAIIETHYGYKDYDQYYGINDNE